MIFPSKIDQFKIYDSRLQHFKNEGNQNYTIYNVPKDVSEVLFYWDYGSDGMFQGNEIIIDDGVKPTEEPTTVRSKIVVQLFGHGPKFGHFFLFLEIFRIIFGQKNENLKK